MGLIPPGGVPFDQGKPALDRFLDRDDAGENIRFTLLDPTLESSPGGGVLPQFVKVIRVEDDEKRVSRKPEKTTFGPTNTRMALRFRWSEALLVFLPPVCLEILRDLHGFGLGHPAFGDE